MPLRTLALTGGLLAAGMAQAAPITVIVTNEQGSGGLALTPVLSVLHGGSYDPFDAGAPAANGVEQIAEEGDVGPELRTLGAEATGVAAAPAGFAGAPVIEPGESARVVIDVDPIMDRYLTFLSMVIPSNDLFIGNDDPFAYEVFDARGAFSFAGPIRVTGGSVWDAGTEVNDGLGAAFSTGGGTATGTTDPIALAGDLSSLLGIDAPTGPITSVPGAGDLLATVRVVEGVAPIPLPAGAPLLLLGLGALGLARRSRG